MTRVGEGATGTAPAAVGEVFRAFARRDADRLCAVCTEDVVFEAVTSRLVRGGEAYQGHEGMRRYLHDAQRAWEEIRPEPQHVEVLGDVVVVTGRIFAWGEGRLVDQAAGWTFLLRDGLIWRAQVHETAEAARAAAGRLGRTIPAASS